MTKKQLIAALSDPSIPDDAEVVHEGDGYGVKHVDHVAFEQVDPAEHFENEEDLQHYSKEDLAPFPAVMLS